MSWHYIFLCLYMHTYLYINCRAEPFGLCKDLAVFDSIWPHILSNQVIRVLELCFQTYCFWNLHALDYSSRSIKHFIFFPVCSIFVLVTELWAQVHTMVHVKYDFLLEISTHLRGENINELNHFIRWNWLLWHYIPFLPFS